jgi:hypothetical protein
MAPMKVRDLIKALCDCPLDCDAYIGKGCGPLVQVRSEVTDRIWVLLEPERAAKPKDGE